jgi:ferritin
MNKGSKKLSGSTSPKKEYAKRENPLISQESIKLLQDRYYQEEMSVRLYYAMSVWLDSQGYTNAAKLWKAYSDDEILHVEKAKQYMLALKIKPEIRSLEQPKNDYETLVDVVEETYRFMLEVSAKLEELAEHAMREKDFMLFGLVQFFLNDQVEAYGNYQRWLDEISIYGSDKHALRLLDNAMGEELENSKK